MTPPTPGARRPFIEAELTASASVKHAILEACAGDISAALDVLLGALRGGRKLLFCGNGGSASDAQHLVTELVIRMDPALKRPAIPALALTTDSSILTAGANDIGYDNVFARQVEALGGEGDVLVGISTSGKSESVNRALTTARGRGMKTIGLLGRGGGPMRALVDVAIIVPSNDTQRIQEGHITIGHILCSLLEREMYG